MVINVSEGWPVSAYINLDTVRLLHSAPQNVTFQLSAHVWMCSRSPLSEHITVVRRCLSLTVINTDVSLTQKTTWLCILSSISSMNIINRGGPRIDH